MDLEKRFLCRVFCILGMLQKPVAIGIHPVLIPVIERRECQAPFSFDALNELFVCSRLHGDRSLVDRGWSSKLALAV